MSETSDWKPGDAAVTTFTFQGNFGPCRIISMDGTGTHFIVTLLSGEQFIVSSSGLRRPTPAEEAEIDRLLPRSQDA